MLVHSAPDTIEAVVAENMVKAARKMPVALSFILLYPAVPLLLRMMH
jgi:hypothetical protein